MARRPYRCPLHDVSLGRGGASPARRRGTAQHAGRLLLLAACASVAALLLGSSTPTLAVGDSRPQEFQEDSLLAQLKRRISRAPKGRLIWIRPGPRFRSGPFVGSADSFWVARADASQRAHAELVEHDASGVPVRIRSLQAPLASNPVMTSLGDQVAVEQGSYLVARDRHGSQRWKASRSFPRVAHLVAAPNGDTLVADHYGRLHRVDWQGRLLWSVSIGGVPKGAPVVGPEGTVVACLQGSGKLVALRPNGTAAWRGDSARCTSAPRFAGDGTLLVPAAGSLDFYSAKGIKIRSTLLHGQLGSPAINADGTAFTATDRGLVVRLSREGKVKWAFPLGKAGATPSLTTTSDGGVLALSPAGYLLCIGSQGRLRWWYPVVSSRSKPWLRTDGAVLLVVPGVGLQLLAPPTSSTRS